MVKVRMCTTSQALPKGKLFLSVSHLVWECAL